MFLQICPALLGIALLVHIEYRIDLTLDDLEIVVFDVPGQVTIVSLVIAWVLRCDHSQRMNRAGNRHIQHMGIIHKICDDIVDRSQNDCILLPPLKLVDGVHLISISQLLADGWHLIPIWCDNTDALEILLMQPRKYLPLNDVDLSLIEMSTGVVAGSCPVHGQYIRLIMVFGHDDQLSMVELLIAEVDDFWVATVVFPQQRNRCVLPYFQCRGQQAVSRKAIPLIQGILLPNGIAGTNVILRQHIILQRQGYLVTAPTPT